MTTTTYPSSQQLISSALTIDQINGIFVPMTQAMLGLNVDANSGDVRTEWPAVGEPFGERTDDICYLGCLPEDGQYNKIREKYISNNNDPDQTVTENWAYTRIWKISWCFYGPNSTDRGRALKSALFLDYFCNQLVNVNLFPVSSYEEPRRAPELINGQWWERVDYDVQMYELVKETITYGAVASVEVIGNDNSGQIFDITVKA